MKQEIDPDSDTNRVKKRVITASLNEAVPLMNNK